MNELILTLPLPPRSLDAHNKGHWRNKSPDVKACRYEAKLMCRGVTPMTGALLGIDIYFPNRIHRDVLNLAQSCKPYIDGVVDAGVLPDDSWQYLEVGHIRAHLDKANPRVVFTFTNRARREG